MKEPDVFEEAIGMTIDRYGGELIKKYDKLLRKAIRKYLSENSVPEREYGPHGASTDWLHPEDVQDAIDKAKVEEESNGT